MKLQTGDKAEQVRSYCCEDLFFDTCWAADKIRDPINLKDVVEDRLYQPSWYMIPKKELEVRRGTTALI